MFSRFVCGRAALGKPVLSATRVRPTTAAPSPFGYNARTGTPDFRVLFAPPSIRPAVGYVVRGAAVRSRFPPTGQWVFSAGHDACPASGRLLASVRTVGLRRVPTSCNGACTAPRHAESLAMDLLMATPAYNGLVRMMAGTANACRPDRLPADERRARDARTAKWRLALSAALAAGCGLFAAYLWSNTEVDAVTGRRRLFLYDDATLERIGERNVDSLVDRYRKCGELVKPSSSVHRRLARLVETLARANSHVDAVRDRQWRVFVVDNPVPGAFVTTNGIIFMTTGQADEANDDQLSTIVGHEMSHCVQRHVNQTISAQFAFNVVYLVVALVVWAKLPFYWALFTQTLVIAAYLVLLELPLSRAMENEADRDGLMMAARACVDVTESARYWRLRDQHKRQTDGGKPDLTWWLSTHPPHSTRALRMSALEPEARTLQMSAGCVTPHRCFQLIAFLRCARTG